MRVRTMVLVVSALVMSLPAFAGSRESADEEDGIALEQAKVAAAATFDRLDVDHNGALKLKALKGRISKKDWAAVDPHKSGGVKRETYLIFVEVAFKLADKNAEGKVDQEELHSPAGRRLERLLK